MNQRYVYIEQAEQSHIYIIFFLIVAVDFNDASRT